jgi:BirA family transcriptional regulator, biotin operon repressor / biotin---[acetyl-CoA-carboxylase] ligase
MKASHKKLVALVAILSDQDFHDGTTLAAHFCVSRTAIWKMIKKLEAYGVEIDSVKGRGYALKTPLHLLDEKIINRQLNTKSVSLHIQESVDSTNSYLKTITPTKKIGVCLAEEQTIGRGRLKNDWYSPFGDNIYCSIRFPLEKDLSELSGLSLCIGCIVADVLGPLVPDGAIELKWPNDVYLDGKKLAGILIEIQAEAHGLCSVIIGVGINVNMSLKNTPKKRITQPWLSLQEATGDYHDRNIIAAHLIDALIDGVALFSSQGFLAYMERWDQRDYLKGKKISLRLGAKDVKGLADGVNEQGQLIIKKANGERTACASGEAFCVR